MSVEARIILIVVLIAVFLFYRKDLRQKIVAWFKNLVNPSPYTEEMRRRDTASQEVIVADRPLKKKTRVPPPKPIGGGLEQRLAVIGELELWYVAGGDQGRPSVLLLHGLTGDKEQWIPVATALVAEGFRVVAPDLPGCGQNAKDPQESYDVTSQVKRLRALIQRLSLAPLHAVGVDVGGTIAAALAYALKEKARSLTLIEPFGVRVPYETELDKLLAQGRNPFLVATPAAYDNLLSFVCSTPSADPRQGERARRTAEDRAVNLKIWQDMREGERANLLDLLLPELNHKTLYLQGASSNVVHPKTADLVPTLMRNATSVVLEGCGHWPMVERPEETAEHLAAFLRSVPAE